MKYKVLRDCHYVHRYWTKDEVAEFPDNVQPPNHFETVPEGYTEPKEVVHVPSTMFEMNEQLKKDTPNTGMGHKPSENGLEPELARRGRPPKK